MPKSPRSKQQEAKRQEQIEASLSAIFRDEAGALPDLTALEPKRHSRAFLLFGGLVAGGLLLIGIAWAGFFIFKPFHGFTGQGLQVSIDGPEQIVLGQEMTYVIQWTNASSDPLASADVRVNFPTDFSVTSLEPAPNSEGLSWRLGTRARGASGEIKIKGLFSGALGTKTALQVVGTYRPASFNSDFEALTSRPLTYVNTVLEGAVTAPTKILPGDRVVVNYSVLNTGSVPMQALEARLSLPAGFVREASSTGTLLDERMLLFPIKDLAPGATTTVSMVGSFASGLAAEVGLHAETGRLGPDGIFKPLQKSDLTVTVLSGDLLLKLVANGSDISRPVSFGETLRFALGYENTALEDIRNVTLRLIFAPLSLTTTSTTKKTAPLHLVDWSTLEDTASSTRAGNTLVWDKTSIGVLERLPPRQDGTIELAVPVPAYTADMPARNFQVTAEANFTSLGGSVVNRTVRATPLIFRLRTDADIVAEARYFSDEGAPLGSGPFPPLVGQATTYRVAWTLSKHLHELKQIQITAPLPKRVSWTNKSSATAGEISYDEAARRLVWKLNRMPRDVNEVQVAFDLQLTPADFDAGRFAELLGETRLEMIDVDINEQLVRVRPALTTDLQNDEGAKSKGVVRKP